MPTGTKYLVKGLKGLQSKLSKYFEQRYQQCFSQIRQPQLTHCCVFCLSWQRKQPQVIALTSHCANMRQNVLIIRICYIKLRQANTVTSKSLLDSIVASLTWSFPYGIRKVLGSVRSAAVRLTYCPDIVRENDAVHCILLPTGGTMQTSFAYS